MQGELVDGLRSLDDGFIPPIIDLSVLDRKIMVSNRDSIIWTQKLLREEGIFAGVSSGAIAYVANRIAGELDEGNVVFLIPDDGWKYLSSGVYTTERRRDRGPRVQELLVAPPCASPEALIDEIVAHSRERPSRREGGGVLRADRRQRRRDDIRPPRPQRRRDLAALRGPSERPDPDHGAGSRTTARSWSGSTTRTPRARRSPPRRTSTWPTNWPGLLWLICSLENHDEPGRPRLR